ncbi:hypothetical protein ACFPPA_07755 [Rhodanobacter ginsengisoli]|uniref:Uncharacterized protein n=1 Tax=Rhodanobacter ginsengisoli TaxID=418646 RepID=A0ABW0QN71_9GAMM
MSNVIDLLEKMGQDPQMRDASSNDVAQALDSAQIDPRVREAILAKDQRLLEALLGSSNVFCGLLPGKQDEEEEDDGEEMPSREDSEISLRGPLRVVASAG